MTHTSLSNPHIHPCALLLCVCVCECVCVGVCECVGVLCVCEWVGVCIGLWKTTSSMSFVKKTAQSTIHPILDIYDYYSNSGSLSLPNHPWTKCQRQCNIDPGIQTLHWSHRDWWHYTRPGTWISLIPMAPPCHICHTTPRPLLNCSQLYPVIIHTCEL